MKQNAYQTDKSVKRDKRLAKNQLSLPTIDYGLQPRFRQLLSKLRL
jgi:hypothetical protein